MNSKLRSRGWLRFLVIAACVPTIGLIVGGVLVGAREISAASQLRQKVNELRQAELPYDNATFAQWYSKHTRPEGADAWVQTLDAVSATSQLGAVDSLPIVGSAKELRELDPKAEWRDETRVKEYLTEMQGLIQQVHQLQKWPTPVQLPLQFNGSATLLPHFQEARSLSRLLQLDFEYAFYRGEFDRAQQDLVSMGTVAKAIDNELCLVVDLIAAALKQTQYFAIQRSLVTDAWSTDKLPELRQIVGHTRYSSNKWKTLFTCERAMFGDDVNSGDLTRVADNAEASFIPLLSSGRLRIFAAYDDVISIGNEDLAALKSASRNVVARQANRIATWDVDGASFWLKMLFPSIEAMARALENEESNRRLTLTAIALRQFKHQEGKWPSRLSDLAKVGLTPADCRTVNRGDFGYEVSEDVAYVWSCSFTQDEPVSDSRPSPSMEYDSPWSDVTVVKLR